MIGLTKPKYLTKYLDEDGIGYVKSGSLKFGTLQSYREGETKFDRMSDKGEGLAEIDVNIGGSGLGTIRYGGIAATVGGDFSRAAMVISDPVNECVFCSTRGQYDEQHHWLMKHGCKLSSSIEYKGNQDLDYYVVFDFDLLISNLKYQLFSEVRFTSKLPLSEVFFACDVQYRPRIRNMNLPQGGGVISTAPITSEEYFGTIFNKPVRFAPENEFRILIRLDAPEFQQPGAPPLKMQSDAFKDCIVDSGKLAGEWKVHNSI